MQGGEVTVDYDKNEYEFFSYAGLWQDRDISTSSIRREAWPRQST